MVRRALLQIQILVGQVSSIRISQAKGTVLWELIILPCLFQNPPHFRFSHLVYADWQFFGVVGRNLPVLHQSPTKLILPEPDGRWKGAGGRWKDSLRLRFESFLPHPAFRIPLKQSEHPSGLMDLSLISKGFADFGRSFGVIRLWPF
jgi:hypothetical protein